MQNGTIGPTAAFLAAKEYVDCENPAVVKKAEELSQGHSTDLEKACAAYRFVRDGIRHPFDINAMAGTPHASEVLRRKLGICHAKSNLLAALLRAMGIPAGFRYQHLTLMDDDSQGYCLHCFNAVWLNGRWIELDARGNKEGVHARFSVGEPVLAFPNRPEYDEYFFDGIYAVPDAPTMALLCRAKTPAEVLEGLPEFPDGKPDIPFGRPRGMGFPEMKEKWLKAFAAGVPEEELRTRVTAEGCYLWHIFSDEAVACEEGDAARETFDTLPRDACYLFEEERLGAPSFVQVRPKPTATEMDREADLYAVAPDFSWTYVRTHEELFGPYFLRRRGYEQV